MSRPSARPAGNVPNRKARLAAARGRKDTASVAGRLAAVEALTAAGRLREAEVSCRSILTEEPSNPVALLRLGEIGLRHAAWEPAAALFSRNTSGSIQSITCRD